MDMVDKGESEVASNSNENNSVSSLEHLNWEYNSEKISNLEEEEEEKEEEISDFVEEISPIKLRKETFEDPLQDSNIELNREHLHLAFHEDGNRKDLSYIYPENLRKKPEI
jgi:hypothetical protein